LISEAKKTKSLPDHSPLRDEPLLLVGRPDPSFTYLLVGQNAPSGPMSGEDCVSFNPATTEVKQVNGRWKIVDGSHWMFDFGSNRAEAEQALKVIKKYGFRYSCFVGRPDPSFTYMRR